HINFNWQLLHIQRNDNNDNQYFILYQTDSGGFVIAGYGYGRVIQYSRNGNAHIGAEYDGNVHQIFRRTQVNQDTFRLINSSDRAMDSCWQFYGINNTALSHENHNIVNPMRFLNARNLRMPLSPNHTELNPLPNLNGINDAGPSPAQAERAIIGSALIPCIFAEDVIPVRQRIKDSPYYVLEYRQYWHRLWSDVLSSGDSRTFTETTGILSGEQVDMRNTIDMSIGADWNLRFGNRSMPFRQQILSGLNTTVSFTNTDLAQREENQRFVNFNSQAVRYARFAKAHEYRLTRTDGTAVRTWVTVDHRTMYLKTFPHNMQVSLQEDTLIKSDNSYDLSLWKTPMKIRDGEIKIKNEHNTKPYHE
ncbi:hypothetical protein, partial [Bacillus cereus]|uniref:hypothetical protein n=1 Tax=Bacillus cereus TaxID=1396 RepID=UPI003D18696C